MSQIFISYAHEDRKIARALAQVLLTRGWSVWWDRKIRTGKAFDDVIQQALDAAECVVVIWSKHSVESRWVRIEAGEADDRQILVPLRIDESRIPLAFRRLQTADMIGWDGSAPTREFARLLDDLAHTIRRTTITGFKARQATREYEKTEKRTQPEVARAGALAARATGHKAAWLPGALAMATLAGAAYYLTPHKQSTQPVATTMNTGVNTRCHDAVQNKLAWNDDGATSWRTEHVSTLCGGAENSEEPARCFARLMQGDVNWGTSSKWQWRNAVSLCAGTSDAQATINCFTTAVNGGSPSTTAIAQCRQASTGERNT